MPQIYALFKQGSGETKFEDAPKPGMFDLKVSERERGWQRALALRNLER
jgi:acyl-CoA-binding protein